jgi:hypothetical protein
MELNTPMKILAFCILSFQSSWYFTFYILWGTKHSLSLSLAYGPNKSKGIRSMTAGAT